MIADGVDQGSLGRRRALLAFVSCVLAAWLAAVASAFSAEAASNEFIFDRWSTEDGLPENSIFSMAQTPDGFLWMATFAGLVRFDGKEFTVFDASNTPELRDDRIVTVDVGPEGSLWVASASGEVARWKSGVFRSFDEREGVPSRGLSWFKLASDGSLWSASRDQQGVFKFQNGRFVEKIPAVQFSPYNVWFMGRDVEGSLWAAAGPNITRIDPPDGRVIQFTGVGPGDMRGMFAGASGIWGCSSRGLWLLTDDGWTRRAAFPLRVKSPASLLEDRHGTVWIGTWQEGLWRLPHGGELELVQTAGVANCRQILEDKEGNIWLATDGYGLLRVRERRFRGLSDASGLSKEIIKTISGDNEAAYVVTQNGWITKVDLETLKTERLTNLYAWSGTKTKTGLWCGGYGNGVWQRENGGTFAALLEEGEKPQGANYCFSEGTDGTIWIGRQPGIARIENGAVKAVDPGGIENFTEVVAIAHDLRGNSYFGSREHGLVRRGASGGWERVHLGTGMGRQRIGSLHRDRRDTIWVGTVGDGLARIGLDGQPQRITAPALPKSIRGIIEDDLGHLWLASAQGIYRVAVEELDKRASGVGGELDVVRYGTTDGLATSECSSGVQPTIWKAPNGALWFATVQGVAIVDPARITKNQQAPPVVIQRLLLDDKMTLAEGGRITMPSGRHRLEVQYGALSFTDASRVRFRHRLKGLDENWTEAGTTRAAYFSRLPPGEYELQITACNNDGVWNAQGATLALSVTPAVWETTAFRVGAVVVVFAGIWGWNETRVRRHKLACARQEAFSRQLLQAQEEDRKRIAAELHDSVGQSLLVIRNRALMARQSATGRGLPVELDEISEAAAETLEEVREISHNLRPYQLDALGLKKALQGLIGRMAGASKVEFTVHIEPLDGALEPEGEINLFRVVQEALSNILKHSGAEQASVRITREPSLLRVQIQDNGSGFDAGAQFTEGAARGFGVGGIVERVRMMGGHVHFESAHGKGTTLRIEIPARKPLGEMIS
ncbi:MAG TPA: two-component regulator propeller domain-containing protein [Methylomirabilota bacterium]|nr:two-component regulator propeller domain-containing protein [Methylomirabilota bacterium]